MPLGRAGSRSDPALLEMTIARVGLVLRLGISSLALVAALGVSGPSWAAPRSSGTSSSSVLVLQGRHVHTRHESFAGPTELTPPRGGPRAAARAGASAARRPPKGRPTRDALDAALAAGQIDQATYDARASTLAAALTAYRNVTGRPQLELGAVIDNADTIAAGGQLTPSRLAPVFATLEANREWWTNGPLLSSGQRVSVGTSSLIWQYYPGQGIELQMLANFGKANALWQSKSSSALRALMSELTPLAADRGGWPAWEYYFKFGGGSPPWTSSISQGTAVQALARAGQMLGDASLTNLGGAGLAAFEQPPPAGVRVDTPAGPFYAIYSYAPDQRVINAHLQAVVGLYDFAQISGDPRALALFQQGDAEAQAVLASYDTGNWSLYDQSSESDLNYHQLTTTFLQNLCKRTATSIYCDTATRFQGYLTVAPEVVPETRKIRAGKPAQMMFQLSKISRVGMSLSLGSQTVFATSALVGRGEHAFTWPRPIKPGLYSFRVTATDLAGNRSQPATTTLRVLAAKKPRKKRARRAARPRTPRP